MEVTEIKAVFNKFQSLSEEFDVKQLTSGHINKTFLVRNRDDQYLLQKMNTVVFQNLEDIMQNILRVSTYLQNKNYPHQVLKPISSKEGNLLVDGQWRLFPFIEDTRTFETARSTEQVYHTAKFLSEFYYYLNGLETDKIKDSIPGFIDFENRYKQYNKVLKPRDKNRLQRAGREIELIKAQKGILEKWKSLLPAIPERIIHADPKISNFLFAKNSLTQIKALIDWDTFMQGTILYDFGDMVRSYTNLKDEDDPDSKNNFSAENYKALKKGFLYYLRENLAAQEINNFDLAAQAVIYVQAVRFLTDYLSGDVYYAVAHPEQNLDRTKNQLNLLEGLQTFLRQKEPK